MGNPKIWGSRTATVFIFMHLFICQKDQSRVFLSDAATLPPNKNRHFLGVPIMLIEQ